MDPDSLPEAPAQAPPVARARDVGLDRFRGGLILLMVAGDYAAGVQTVPPILKHAPDIGLTLADLVAPGFVFAIGLTYVPSFARRFAASPAGAYRHVVLRYLALVGIGAILSAGGTVVAGQPTDWGVLQALGVAGLLAVPFVRLGPLWRAAAGILILVAYQLVLDAWLLPSVLGSVHGGFFGAIAWGGLLILSTAVGDLWRAGMRPYLLCCAGLAVAAVSSLLVPISKNRVSLSYLLITLAIAALSFLLVELAARVVPRRPGFFAWWGENPLVLYLLHLLILGIFLLPGVAQWYAATPFWIAVLNVLGVLAVMSVVAWWLHRRGLQLRI